MFNLRMGYLQCLETTPKENLKGGGGRGLLWYVYVHLWVPIPFAPKLTNHEENRDSLTSVIVTMDMVEKYMEPKVNAKLKSNP